MKCNICSKKSTFLFEELILFKYKVKFYHCSSCDFIQSEDPYWLNEAYLEPINIYDTGLLYRNIFYSKKTSILLSLLNLKNGRFLDYAGGYGVFVRLMRDFGFEFLWHDIYTKNLFAKGFNWPQEKVTAITFFEVMEHFVDPIKEISKLLKFSELLIFSTELMPCKLPNPKEWSYYGFNHGQHISFYSTTSLKQIAQVLDLNYYHNKSFHIFSKKKIPRLFIYMLKLQRFGLHKFLLNKSNSFIEKDSNL